MHSIFRKPIIRQWMDDESKPVLLSVGTPKNVALGLCVWCTWTPPTKKKQCNQLKIPLTFFIRTLKFGVVALCCSCCLSLSHGFDVCLGPTESLLVGCYSLPVPLLAALQHRHLDLTRERASLRHDVLQFDVAMNQLLPMKHLVLSPCN